MALVALTAPFEMELEVRMPSEDEKKLFRTQLGLTSTVSRETHTDEQSKQANLLLAQLGELVNPLGPDKLNYLGSAAVHVFYNETLEQAFFVTQADGLKTHACPELLAQAAITDLVGTTLEKYGHKRPVKRNGF